MKRYRWAAALAAVMIMLLDLAAQEPAGTTRPAPPEKGILQFPHMRVDLKNRRVTIEARACQSGYGLEFLLCRKNTKEYESVLTTEASGANLHAALLAMGLTPGKPARWSGGGKDARFLPPQGPELAIRLVWQDEKGRHETDASAWLKNSDRANHAPPKAWIFIGSWVLPDGRYVADLTEEGGLISVANQSSAVIDVPFESTQALEQRIFVPNDAIMPKPDMPVEVIIEPQPGAEHAAAAVTLLEIDRFGRQLLDGRPVTLEALGEWARKYMQEHEEGMVLIRADAMALVDDVRQAREALQFGGVREIEEIYRAPDRDVPPRTAEQAGARLAEWKRRLSADPATLLTDPRAEAAATMEHLEAQREEDHDIQEVRRLYALKLRELLKQYPVQTSPARPSPASGPAPEAP